MNFKKKEFKSQKKRDSFDENDFNNRYFSSDFNF